MTSGTFEMFYNGKYKGHPDCRIFKVRYRSTSNFIITAREKRVSSTLISRLIAGFVSVIAELALFDVH